MSSRSILFLPAILLGVVAISPMARTAVADQGEPERWVLAFYYAWFDANTWKSGTVSDLPQVPYNSDEPSAMERHIEQARRAGINAFVLNWWGVNNRTERNLTSLLDQAASRGFRVSAVLDLNSPLMSTVRSYTENLAHLHQVHAAHPAYLRHRGKPVVVFYNVSRLPVATWASIRDSVDPDRHALWIAEGTDLSYLNVFDGHHLYSITWPNRVPPERTLAKWGDRVRSFSRSHGAAKLWVATVMPGYDDRLVRPSAGFAQSRESGAYYRECWRAAITSQADWIIINSFNEWAEGTQIESSQAYGDHYITLTAELADQFLRATPTATTAPATAPASGFAAQDAESPAGDRAAATRQPPSRPGLTFPAGSTEPGCGYRFLESEGHWTIILACRTRIAPPDAIPLVD